MKLENEANDYHFITHWRIPASVQEVIDILDDPRELVRWWPSVYLRVQVLEPGDAGRIGQVIDLYTKGWLPYTLRWRFRIAEIVKLRSITLEAEGDFVGRGRWEFAPASDSQGEWTDVTYDWRVRAAKPLLRRLSFLMKPVFSANHHWAMRMGEKSLLLELARRRAATPAECRLLPAPPGPTFAFLLKRQP